MKVFLVVNIFLLVCVSCIAASDDCNHSNGRRKRDVMQTCVVNGEPVDHGCEYICCGNKLISADSGLECCGGKDYGAPFDSSYQICCEYEFTKEANVYNKTDDDDFCCGVDLYTAEHRSNSGCCNGGDPTNDRPAAKGSIFNWMTEMCCMGFVTNVGDTAHGSCCGIVGYDRRNNSCPCNNGVVGVGIVHEEARCCASVNGTIPYNYKYQTCCNGKIVDNPTGDDGQIIPGNRLVCCDDKLMEVDSQKVCCDGKVEDGDACCSGSGYFSADGICCQETLGAGPFTWGSCCGPTPYDAFNSTCCGLDVMPNPIVNIAGNPVTSHNTRCCGDYSVHPLVLEPYDYFTSACCGGVVNHFGDLNSFNALCCNTSLLNGTEFLCCNNVPVAKVYGEDDTVCCGSEPMHASQECCGGQIINPATVKCCNGVPRNMGGIPAEKVICCGDGCVDGRDYYCCQGKQVLKDTLTVEDVISLDCLSLGVDEEEGNSPADPVDSGDFGESAPPAK